MAAIAEVLPPGCVTGVGSLPMLDAGAAVELVARASPLLPFWPQLPRRHAGEGVIAQGLGPLIELLEPAARPFCWRLRRGAERAFTARVARTAPGLAPETAAGFFAFERALRAGAFPRMVAIKGQMEGPITLAHCLFAGEEPLAGRPGWLDRLASFLARQAVWQIRRLRAAGRPVVFMIDEPAMCLAPSGIPSVEAAEMVRALGTVLRAARAAGALAGVHCCAQLAIRPLLDLEIDIMSFDAHLPIDGNGFADLAQRVVRGGGSLAFGLVRTDSPGSAGEDARCFARWLSLASLIGEVPCIARRTLVTATCGLGLSDPSRARASFEQCRRVGEMIARLSRSTRCPTAS